MTVHALRSFRRNPWFAATAVLTLALGLAAAVSIFTVVNRVLLAPLPYSHPDGLVWISTWNAERGQYSKSSGFDFNVWKQQTDTFDAVEAYWDRAYTITGTSPAGGPRRLAVHGRTVLAARHSTSGSAGPSCPTRGNRDETPSSC